MAAKDLGRVLLGTVLLLLMCLASGRPQVFSDTRAYYALGQEVASLAAPGMPAPGTQALRGHPLPPGAAREQTRLAYTVAASRSPYWSTLFYLAVQAGSAWLVVVAQAATAALVVWIAMRGLGVGGAYLPTMALLGIASSLPVEAMFLMPDVFAGLTILAALTLVVARAPLARWERGALWITMAAGALFHTSHLLTLGALGALTLAAGALARHGHDRRAGGAMLAAAAVALVGALAFPAAVERVRHEPIYAPPFVSARLIADGPGRALLAADCRLGTEWGWCPYRGRPMTDVNDILWSRAPATATFQAAGYDRRVRIIREQPRFAAAVALRYPGAVLREVADNVGSLFLQFGTAETLGDATPLYRDPGFAIFARIVPGTAACAAGRRACATRLDLPLLDRIIGGTLLAAAGVIAALLLTQAGRRAWGRAALFLLAAMGLNAVLCGSISGNAQRYQSRITWLVPLLAAAMLAERHVSRRPGRPVRGPMAGSLGRRRNDGPAASFDVPEPGASSSPGARPVSI